MSSVPAYISLSQEERKKLVIRLVESVEGF